MNRWSLSLAAFCAATLVGCSSPARYVVRESSGGVVAIPSNTNAWPGYHRKRAEELMRQHYPDGYEIVREEEAVTGTHTQSNTQHRPGMLPFMSEADTTTTTTDQTEWRIYYRPRSEPSGADPNQPAPQNRDRRPGALSNPREDMLPGERVKPTINVGYR